MKPNVLRLILLVCIAFILSVSYVPQAKAQQVVQLSGLVTSADSLAAIAGIAVFVPYTLRGTQTNRSGFFSLPVLPGDSVVIAGLGFEKQYILIPVTFKSPSYAASIVLKPESIKLPTVDVMPWATERDLRAAVAKVKLQKEPNTEVDMEVVYKKIQRTHYPMDAGANIKHGLQQLELQRQNRYRVQDAVKLFGVPIR